MAVALLEENPVMTPELYDQVRRRLDLRTTRQRVDLPRGGRRPRVVGGLRRLGVCGRVGPFLGNG
jgi:hypothetical protein